MFSYSLKATSRTQYLAKYYACTYTHTILTAHCMTSIYLRGIFTMHVGSLLEPLHHLNKILDPVQISQCSLKV